MPIGVGREGHSFSGVSTISAKRQWPDWSPTPNIRKLHPELPGYVKGGDQNPLGARALYLGDSLYRIHGTNEPWKIGDAVSSGCIRLTNDDIIDLYNRSKVGATVIVQR
jgi:lipoprotein-anchoring transpeptidase ErfK/SrfK